MKKILAVLMAVAMLAVTIPVSTVGALAETSTSTAKPTDTWTSSLDYVDLSWCATLDAANSDKTVTVGDKHYYVKGDWTKKDYEITTAAQLAGLAYLSNLTSGDLFKGDVFTIKADIDLGEHLWEPISKTSKFRGAIIGDVNGEPAVISNMIIDTSATGGISVGLVGQFGGDCISNLTLKNAEITANSFTVGSFVGWQNGNIGAGRLGTKGYYENLVSDAKITITSGRGDRFDDVGGIVGYINSTNDGNNGIRFTGCVFTGTISAPYGDMVGGIIGGSQYDGGKGLEISDCVVISEKIEWGKNNYYITKGSEEHNTGLGGIAGSIYTNGSADNLSYTVKNCYVAAKLVTLSTEGTLTAKNVGGMCGVSCAQGKTFENCQFDGAIIGAADGAAGILSRYMTKGTVKNCVVSGIAIAQNGKYSTLVGRTADSNLTVDGVYGSVKMLNGVNGTEIPQITSSTDLSALLAVKNGEDNVWTRAEGQLYPVLAIALPYLTGNTPSVAKSGADMSFFSLSDTAEITVDTTSRLDGTVMIMRALSENNCNAFVNRLAITLDITSDLLERYEEKIQYYIVLTTGVDLEADDSKISMEFVQLSVDKNVNKEKPQFDGTYNVRIVAKMKDTSFAGVRFDYAVVQNGDTVLDTETAVIKECYRSLTAYVNGEASVIEAEDGYFVVFVIKNLSLDDVNTVLTLRANGINADGSTVKSSRMSVTLDVPSAN